MILCHCLSILLLRINEKKPDIKSLFTKRGFPRCFQPVGSRKGTNQIPLTIKPYPMKTLKYLFFDLNIKQSSTIRDIPTFHPEDKALIQPTPISIPLLYGLLTYYLRFWSSMPGKIILA